MQTERPEAARQQSVDELFKKLELFEVTLEKQQRILQEHNIKIKEMKDAVAKVDRGIQVDIGKPLSVFLLWNNSALTYILSSLWRGLYVFKYNCT